MSIVHVLSHALPGRPCIMAAGAVMALTCTAANAAPTLSAGIIADLKGLEQALAGDPGGVESKAEGQADRLQGGNASDRWARALYLQLAASAEASLDKPLEAADHLAAARSVDSVETSQRDRWQRQEAGLRLAAERWEEGSELLADWLERHPDSVEDQWLMAQLAARREAWDSAADWVDAAHKADPSPTPERLALLSTVMQRSGRLDAALEALEAQLRQAGDDPEAWRRAAALAQRLGDPGRAAALWESAWRRGLLSGAEDLERRIRLHLAAGTPARAAELLSSALADGRLADTPANRRLLAQAWQAARSHDRALSAWQAVAEESGAAEDWLTLGQLASGWDKTELARQALTRAQRGGADGATAWLAALGDSASGSSDQ